MWRCVMITAFASVETAVEAMRRGAFHYVTKPFDNATVRALVARRPCRRHAPAATKMRSAARMPWPGRSRFERLVGQSRAMQDVYRLIEQVAPSRGPRC